MSWSGAQLVLENGQIPREKTINEKRHASHNATCLKDH